MAKKNRILCAFLIAGDALGSEALDRPRAQAEGRNISYMLFAHFF
jgi:hypothetical protein